MKLSRRKALLVARMLRALPPPLILWSIGDDGRSVYEELRGPAASEYPGKLFTVGAMRLAEGKSA